jgi:hypothetical protein
MEEEELQDKRWINEINSDTQYGKVSTSPISGLPRRRYAIKLKKDCSSLAKVKDHLLSISGNIRQAWFSARLNAVFIRFKCQQPRDFACKVVDGDDVFVKLFNWVSKHVLTNPTIDEIDFSLNARTSTRWGSSEKKKLNVLANNTEELKLQVSSFLERPNLYQDYSNLHEGVVQTQEEVLNSLTALGASLKSQFSSDVIIDKTSASVITGLKECFDDFCEKKFGGADTIEACIERVVQESVGQLLSQELHLDKKLKDYENALGSCFDRLLNTHLDKFATEIETVSERSIKQGMETLKRSYEEAFGSGVTTPDKNRHSKILNAANQLIPAHLSINQMNTRNNAKGRVKTLKENVEVKNLDE